MTTRAVLVGAGHAHLLILAAAQRLRDAQVEPVLVAPRWFHYSGLATGVLSGALDPRAARLDVAALAARCGVRHLITQVEEVDCLQRQVALSDGSSLDYDRLSLNAGSRSRDPHGLAHMEGVWAAKPLTNLVDLQAQVLAHVRRTGASPALAVAGGGPTGFELAAALAGLLERQGIRPQVSLVAAAPAAWGSAGARHHLTLTLTKRGVGVVAGEVVARTEGACALADGRSLACDMLVLASGLEASPLMAELGLPLGPEGRLRVAATLQSIGDQTVFAAGDCATVEGQPRPAAGVFGVRAAPTLLRNLVAGPSRRLARYQPQRRWLSIMDLGDGTSLALRGKAWGRGRWALWLKRRLDLGFLARLRKARSGKPL